METMNKVIELTPTKEISRHEVKDILSGVNFPTFVSMVSNTPVEMNKFLGYWIIIDGQKKKNPNPTPNLFYDKGVFKLSKKYQIVTGFDYEKSVNRRLESEGKEGDFKSEENWFEPISKGLVTDKRTHTKFYFRYQHTDQSTIWKEFYYDGQSIEEELFKSFVGERDNTYKKQGLENPLKFQVCDLNHILTFSFDKEIYKLTGKV
jgi:hypothetical protein